VVNWYKKIPPVQTLLCWDRPHGRCSFNLWFCQFQLLGAPKICISFGNLEFEMYWLDTHKVRALNMPGTNDQMEARIRKLYLTKRFRFLELLNGSGLRCMFDVIFRTCKRMMTLCIHAKGVYNTQVRRHTRLAVCTCGVCCPENRKLTCQHLPRRRNCAG